MAENDNKEKNEKDNSLIWKIIVIILLLLLFGGGGFFLGRWTIKTDVKTVVEYVKLDPIHDTITNIKPVYVTKPADTLNIIKMCIKDGIYAELFPNKIITDTMIITKSDTSSILIDWGSERLYSNTLFDIDTIGKCEVNTKVQYNRMLSMDYIFYPVQKQTTTTITKVRLFEPFLGVGLSPKFNKTGLTGTAVDLQGGFFIKSHFGVSLQYQYDFMQKDHSVGGLFMYKF